MGSAEKAGVAYFGAVFTIGFVFGTIRVLLLEGRVATELAVALELPVMLALSWLVARHLIRRFAVGDAPAQRLRMGFLAFALLLLAETGLALALGQTVSGHIASYATLRGALTLVGQLVFALIPLLIRAR